MANKIVVAEVFHAVATHMFPCAHGLQDGADGLHDAVGKRVIVGNAEGAEATRVWSKDRDRVWRTLQTRAASRWTSQHG